MIIPKHEDLSEAEQILQIFDNFGTPDATNADLCGPGTDTGHTVEIG